MSKYKNKYRIESNRARFWDYSYPGDYYITVCIEGGKHILGSVENGVMILSEYGKILESEFEKISEYHPRTTLGVWVVMPNHIHFIVSLGEFDNDNGNDDHDGIRGDNGNDDHDGICDDNGNDDHDGIRDVEKIHEFSLPSKPAPPQPWWHNPNHQPTIDEIKQYRKHRRKMVISKILGKFKQQTSKKINILRNTAGTKNWQPDYYDHVIRNQRAYNNIQKYIINNPKNWTKDKFYGND